MALSPQERDNLVVWDGARRPHYEVYYLKLNDVPTRTAAWLRYTLLAPAPGKGDPVAELWGIFFFADDPKRNIALKKTFPIEEAVIARDRFSFRIGNAEITNSSARGGLERNGKRLDWTLRWEPNRESFRHLPYAWMYRAPVPKTKVISPNLSVRFHGEITAGGDRVILRGAPGQQTHIWGTKHADRWVWGHCNAFEEDSEALFEGLTAQVKIAGRRTPPLSTFHFRYRGESHTFNRGRQLLRAASQYELGEWRFDLSDRHRRFVGRVSSRLE
ncbi:MAG: hypothetical protein ACRD1Z_08105, partial [Vicinamibacteria bacterium]